MNPLSLTLKKLGLVFLTLSVAFTAACRKKKSADDSTDIDGIGAIPVVVSGDQPVTGNGKVTVGGGGTPVRTDDDGTVPPIDGGPADKLVELGADINAHGETALEALKISDIGTHPTYLWSKVSGPGAVSFTDSAAVPTYVSAAVDGSYVLRLTVTYADGRVATDDVNFVWDTHAPTVDVGGDQSRKAAYLQNATTSDAVPFASVPLVYAWSKVSGPGSVTFSPANDKDTTISVSQDGTYVLRLTANDVAGNASYDELVLTWDTSVPAVNAGADFIAKTATTLSATATDSTALTYAWAKVSGPGAITFGDATALDTTVSAGQDGTYVLRLTATDANGNAASDTVQMTWDTTDPAVNAGVDQLAKVPFTQEAAVTDATALTYQWSQVGGPGTVSFGSPTAQDTTISANASGVYTIRLVATDAIGNSASDDFTLTWDLTAPVVDAGSDKTVGATVTANTTTSDLTAMTYQWTKVSGPGTITFGSATAKDTTINASSDGTYLLRLTATDALGNAAHDDLAIVWDTTPPSVSAGTDKAAKAQVSQDATVSDATAITYSWSKVTGPGALTFGSGSAEDTTISADASGVYTVRLTATDVLGHVASDTMTLTWDVDAPVVNAGADATSGSSISRTATASDLTAMTYQWSKVSGPGTITFGTASSLTTTIAASQDGTYVLRLTATDALANSAFDEFTYTLDTGAPTVDAGLDRVVQAQVSQNATVTGTGPFTYLWSKESGPGTITFGTATAEDTTISASSDGHYQIRLTATNQASASGFDLIDFYWDTAAPASVDAGTDQTVKSQTSLAGTATDLTAMTYQWSKVSGPGTLSFGSATAATTTVSASAGGTYVVRFTATDALGHAAYDDMTLNWDLTAPVVNAGTDATSAGQISQNATVTDASAVTYQWTKQSGPGTITFGTAAAEDTTISASVEGVYVIRLTATDAAGNSAYDEMTFTYDTANPAVNAGADRNVNAATSLLATAMDLTAMTYQWTKQSGPGTITFGNSTALGTTASASASGTYVIRFTATDAVGHAAYDELTFVWDTTSPAVNAGVDRLTKISISQDATVTDANAVTYQWTKISGPGTLTFGTPTAEDTTITASEDGVYVARLTVTDAAGNSAFDDMQWTFDTTPPSLKPGSDKAVSVSTLQDATATDLTTITYSWTQLSGPGTLSFGAPSAQDTTIAASLYGIYTARLTATDAVGNSATDDITFKWIRFSLGWSFDVPGDYTYDVSKIAVAGGSASLVPVALASAVDSVSTDFNAGTHSNTAYSGTGVQLNAAGLTAKAGTFTSRIMNAGAAVNWDRISWTADRPYQKDLPDNQVNEGTFDAGNIDMTGNVLLWHANETSGSTLTDTSGNGNNGTCASCPSLAQAGMIGSAATFNAASSNYYSIPVSSSLRLSGNATFAAWIYPTTLSSYTYILERGNNDVDNYAFVVDSSGGASQIKLATEFVDNGSGAYQFYQSAATGMTVNNWYHVAMVIDDTNNTLKFFVNGAQVGTTIAMPYTMRSSMNDALLIGKQNFTPHNFYWPGKLDEVGIWNRAMADTEILKLYQRGAMSVKFQARACADATCSANPAFVGQDGTNATDFGNYPVGGQGSAWAMSGFTGMQYIQYKAFLNTYTSSISPVVKTVSFAKFLNTAPPISTNSGYPYTNLIGFDVAVGTGHLGTVFYQLSPDGTNWYWHNGTTWTAAANTVAQANTRDQVNSKIGTFAGVAGPGTLMVRAYLNATSGAETIDLKDVLVTGDNGGL